MSYSKFITMQISAGSQNRKEDLAQMRGKAMVSIQVRLESELKLII